MGDRKHGEPHSAADLPPPFHIIPAKAEIQSHGTPLAALDGRFRGHDDSVRGEK